MTPSEMIDRYIKLRNKISKIKDEHTKQLAPYHEVQQRLETEMLDHLNKNDLTSVAGDAGTAYKAVATSVVVKDWPTTLSFIRENELWELLEARVSKTGAVQQIEESGAPVPGVQVSQAMVVRVRAN